MTKQLMLLFLAIVLAIPATSASARPGEQTCQEPAATGNYDTNGIVYGLRLDLSGCDWWDHSPIRLRASLLRRGGLAEEGADTVVVCGQRLLRIDPKEDEAGDKPDRGKDKWVGLSPCEIVVALDHPPVEAARYHGEIAYPWSDGERLIAFDALCVTAGPLATCRAENR